MTRVPNLGVGGGLKHLRGVEGLKSTAAIAGGRLTGSHVRKPVGHDLLSGLPLLELARRVGSITFCRSQRSWLSQ